jgi:LPPG:FO 2-phospho-L-lactate transferase
VILIGPSNPLVSIGPILAVPGMREALSRARAPVVAVSPIVGGEVLKGPTAAFMAFAGQPCSAAGVRELYRDLLDGIVADETIEDSPRPTLPSLHADTRMDDATGRARVARETVAFAESLTG